MQPHRGILSQHFLVTAIAALAFFAVAIQDGGVNALELEVAGVGALLLSTLFLALRRADVYRIGELEHAAVTDPLTGALNRRGFTEWFQAEIDRATRSGEPVSLVIGDLDGFKEVNDRLGHMGGDMALERVSALLYRSKRSTDLLARLGGEEFAIVLPGADSKPALRVAERLRGEVAAGFEGSPVAVTMSVGVATYPRDGRTLEEVLHAADVAMYAAKRSGKNRSLAYSPEMADEAEHTLALPNPEAEG